MRTDYSRFAPSATGRAHPGTLLAALLSWLDARSRRNRLLLRLEDIDPQRCRADFVAGLQDDLAWFGLDYDAVELQSAQRDRHEAALDRLAAQGLLYPCSCSRATIRRAGRPGADGGYAYPNSCRGRELRGDWRDCGETLRLRLPDTPIRMTDESGAVLDQDVGADMGDPVLRRRDGAMAYHLAAVVDDAASGVTRVVRGRDLAASTATQVAVQRALGLPTPRYRHHLLLLEADGGKLAKFHGAVAVDELRARYRADELCGLLGRVAGLRDDADPVTPAALLAGFDWGRVRADDQVLAWDGRRLHWRAEAVP